MVSGRLLLGALLGSLQVTVPSVAPVARLTQSYIQHLAAPPERVFPLLGPAGEKKWADHDWTPRFVYPPTGVDEPGCIFTTRGPHGESVWVLTAFDERRGRVEYLEVTPGVLVTEIRIVLLPEGEAGTAATITYTRTALSVAGRKVIATHRGTAFTRAMAEWERVLNAYLKNPGKE
jgi:hypothetical protein